MNDPKCICGHPLSWHRPNALHVRDARTSFANFWDSINAKRGYSWESNPWVWAITFRRIVP